MTLKRLRPYLDYLESQGVEVISVVATGSSHYKISVTRQGSRRFFIAPFSASCRRALLNWQCDVRRWMNATNDQDRGTHDHPLQNTAKGSKENHADPKPQHHDVVRRGFTQVPSQRCNDAVGHARPRTSAPAAASAAPL